jgi:predicted SAM-dependent methyltransferase
VNGVVMKKINVGCGPSILDGWLNADLHPIDRRVIKMDATQQWPFSNGEFDRVFSEHMIEHVPYEGGKIMLEEAFRTLKPGGRIRISTPSIDFLANLLAIPSQLEQDYIEWACENFSQNQPVCAETVVNNFVRAWGHQFIWSEKLLKTIMFNVGFDNIDHCFIGDSRDPEFVGLENASRMPDGFLQLETMTIEAEKPLA